MTPKVVDKSERRAEILDAAVRVFARRGYHATRVSDIAREAGVAQGTVYLYFGSRDGILTAAFGSFAEEMRAGVSAVLESGKSALDRFRSLVREVLSSLQSQPDLSRVMLDFWSAGTFWESAPEERPGIDPGSVYVEYRGLFSDLLDEAAREGSMRGDLPENTSAVIVGAIEGVLVQWIVEPEVVSPLEITDTMLDVLLNGLGEGRISL